MRFLLPLSGLILLTACQKDQIEVRHVPKEESAGMSGMAMGPETGMGAPAAAGVHWKAPRGWKELAGSGMRVATLQPPPGAGKAEVTVIALPGDVGGELANVNRWRGQIALPAIAEGDLPGARKSLRAKLGAVSLYDFTSEGGKKTRLVAGMIQNRGTTWFFKLMGDEKAVAAARPDFVKLLEGLTADAR